MNDRKYFRRPFILVFLILFFLFANSALYTKFNDSYNTSEEEMTQTYTLNDVMNASDNIEKEQGGIQVSANDVQNESGSGFDLNDWKLLLINKQHAVPTDYEFTLGIIKGSMKCDERIIPELSDMMQAAQKDNINLIICSPYRDMSRQEDLFNRKIKIYLKRKMSYLDAYKTTAQAVTVPGASEHQVGLALDIVSDSYMMLDEGFADTSAGKWLKKHCAEYGFILRYPKGKEDITGIEFEPWHYRYVGKDAATVIMQKGITLEEFVESLEESNHRQE